MTKRINGNRHNTLEILPGNANGTVHVIWSRGGGSISLTGAKASEVVERMIDESAYAIYPDNRRSMLAIAAEYDAS
jgi:hypothetical protein